MASEKGQRIGLFAGGERGYAVLDSLIGAGRTPAHVLILEEMAHEYNRYAERLTGLCDKHGIDTSTSGTVKPRDYARVLEDKQLDVMFAISWRFMIPEVCFGLVRRGIFVLHDSLLPRNRGFAPTNWVIINQERTTGLTLQYIDKDVDAGDIVDQIEVPIAVDETATSLNKKFLALYPELILRNLEPILNGTCRRIAQDHSLSTFLCKRTPDDGRIDFSKSTGTILALIRGLSYPYPGAFCCYRGKKVRIWEAKDVDNPPNYVGRVFGRPVAIAENHVDVLTGDGVIRILSVGEDGSVASLKKPKEVVNSIHHTLT